MTDTTPTLTDEQREITAGMWNVLNDIIVDHPMWIGDDGEPLDYLPEREARIHRFIEETTDALAPLIARMVADAEARALREAADPIALDHATHFCGWRVLDHDMQPRPVDACKMPTAVALADWLRARADSLAAQPAPEEGCSSCGLYGGGHAHPDCEGAQPAPEAATVEEVRPSDVRKVVSEALDDVANNLMPRPTSDERIAIRVLAAFDVRRKP